MKGGGETLDVGDESRNRKADCAPPVVRPSECSSSSGRAGGEGPRQAGTTKDSSVLGDHFYSQPHLITVRVCVGMGIGACVCVCAVWVGAD